MIRVVASNDPVDIAWTAFDAAALKLHRMYSNPASGASSSAERMAKAQEVVRLWDEWRKLFLDGEDGPAPAA